MTPEEAIAKGYRKRPPYKHAQCVNISEGVLRCQYGYTDEMIAARAKTNRPLNPNSRGTRFILAGQPTEEAKGR